MEITKETKLSILDPLDFTVVGRINGNEWVMNGLEMLFRIDGNEVYSNEMPTRLIGYVDSDECIVTPDKSKVLWIIQNDEI